MAGLCEGGNEPSVSLKAICKRRKGIAGSLAEEKLPTEGCTGRKGEREKIPGQKKIKMYGSYAEAKRKAENREDWSNAEFAVKDLLLGRTL
ncbi:hypothetical protein ANN_09211 [Periplaneta americana]|uniref:Uncharacterized protein n=1 Tax=Periplaneta americana TaxID=6978 RepID=A0ABQ8TL48_PERAM|nr:hypothetical protein ANN_09211 [Periplaneta americana]